MSLHRVRFFPLKKLPLGRCWALLDIALFFFLDPPGNHLVKMNHYTQIPVQPLEEPLPMTSHSQKPCSSIRFCLECFLVPIPCLWNISGMQEIFSGGFTGMISLCLKQEKQLRTKPTGTLDAMKTSRY